MMHAPSSARPALLPAADAIASALEGRGFAAKRSSPRDAEGELLVDLREAGFSEPVAINPGTAISRLRPGGEWALLLWWHGIPVDFEHLPPDVPRPVRPPRTGESVRVRVHVADLRALCVEVEAESDTLDLPGGKYQRLAEAACRSVYLLGLHYAAVTLRVLPGGGWCIAGVDPFPRAAEELASAYGESIAALVAALAGGAGNRDEAVLGADPEFLMATQQGRVLYASRYLEQAGTVGYDRQSRGRLGTVYPLVEVRPSPSPSPIVLAANTERALAEAAERLPTRSTRWMAGSYPLGAYPTGGHIHFSGVPLTTPVLSALDNYLALPVMLLEDRRRSRQRRRKYGRLGDFRRKDHGGFEYRTLPSWLVSKEAARAVLCLAKVVAAEWHSLTGAPLQTLPMVKRFYQGRKAQLRRFFPALWRRLLKTRTARAYRYELSYIPRALAGGCEWDDEADFKKAWWD